MPHSFTGSDRIMTQDLALPTHAERLGPAALALAPVTETPQLDAEILLAHALGISRAQLLARLKERAEAPAFDAFLERRLKYEPLAYILREWDFYSLMLDVEPPLLVPRPETEHLVEVVLEQVGRRSAAVLELGTGTGCVAVAIARNGPEVRVVATDINADALEVAAKNAERHHVGHQLRFLQGHWFDALTRYAGSEEWGGSARFDVICSNPPYIEEGAWSSLSPVIRLHEDSRALLSGPDGLDAIRHIASSAPPYLNPGGLLALELGAGQDASVREILAQCGFTRIGFREDLAGINRIAFALAPES